MSSDSLKKIQIKEFIKDWEWIWDEKQHTQKFWNQLLWDIFGIKSLHKFIDFEKRVNLKNTSFIDAYIPSTRILIEQKSHDVNLTKPENQSDWTPLTPYEQAKRYNDNLPLSQKARRIVVSNFQEFLVYDMEKAKPHENPEQIYLKDLEKEFHRLKFLVDTWDKNIKKEMEISIKAWEIVWKLYDSLAPLYKDITNPKSQKSLNVLCVRLVFCLYAEDAGVFWIKNLFHDYLNSYKTDDLRDALIKLFVVLDQKENERDQYLKEDLKKFPYVNWWLFADENIEIPNITEEVRDLLLRQASEDFDRSEISPTIFWAVFESTLNPETRRSGGMHYTSIENIHKVIDPLFLDDLNEELNGILKLTQPEAIRKKWKTLQQKMANLKFLDPACGSWNFLTETYLSLRRIENKIIKKEWKWVARLINPIEVNINQFYWIEINDFAVDVARTALWIAESQMMHETEEILWESLDFLPLKTNANIVKWNALRMDWNEVISNKECDYIMWNPPFIGSSKLTEEQKEDRENIFWENWWELDYVACRYKKSINYIESTNIECAFVSTNSICQWQQVFPLRKPLFDKWLKINFAHKSFIWTSEASWSAKVVCIIVWFSLKNRKIKKLYNNNEFKKVDNINAYLLPMKNIFIEKSKTPLFKDAPIVIKWFQPTDNWNLILEDEEKEELLKKSPSAEKRIRPFITAKEYVNNKNRWCLRLKWITPNEINSIPQIKQRVENCKKWRESQKKTWDAFKLKDIPTLMRPTSKFKESSFIVLPRHTTSSRKYIPFWYVEPWCIPWDSISLINNANLYVFWIIESSIHMLRTDLTCWRLWNWYRYTSDIVYNNFPRPSPTIEQKTKIEQTAQAILNARNLYPDSSLADLYDELTMPIELRKAHQENDKAVMQAYGFSTKMTESECVAKLMEMYEKLVSN